MSAVLIGMMGVGKSTMGRQAAAQLHFRFADLDLEVERHAGMKVSRIFGELGEAAFREMETEALRALAGTRSLIVAAGGGAPLREGNMELMRGIGKIVYLRASEETLLQRVLSSSKKRPLLECEDVQAKVHEMLAMRAPTYERADFVIDIDSLSRLEIIHRIAMIAQGSHS